MAPAASSLKSIQAMQGAQSTRNGMIGFASACGFLVFVSKFNEKVQTYKADQNIKKGPKIAKGMSSTMRFILGTTCGTREVSSVFALSMCLLLRTLGSVWVARHWGKIVNSLVLKNFSRMAQLLAQFSGGTIFLAVLNALLKYYIATLKRNVREKVTFWAHQEYMKPKDMIFYKANKVATAVEDKLENCDNRIASDVDKFADLFAEVLSQSLKPVVDFLVYSVELSAVQGLTTPLTLYAWFAFASCVSTLTLPPFGEFAALEQKLEGQFRGVHNDLITNCEQIAFLGGEKPELKVLNAMFKKVLDHDTLSINMAFKSECIRQYLNKYFVTVIGLYLVGRPVRLNLQGMGDLPADQISQYFVTTWRSMEAIASSIQDLFELTNRIGKLSGLAQRVSILMSGLKQRKPVLQDNINKAMQGPHPPKFVKGDHLNFENVSVFKPDGTLLAKELNFSVKRGQRILVTGSNGCGKSSLFRIIRKLWPLVSGTITMPDDDQIYFLTQVNFVPVGSLRDLVIYPHSAQDMKANGRTDADVWQCLEWSHVSPEVIVDGMAELQFTVEGKVERPGLDDVRDWHKDLSPGQKQKIAFARLFYHKAAFVVLDECTNGISPDVELELYDHLTKLGVGIFSISHKLELKKWHDWELHYHGDAAGSWEWVKCSETIGQYTGARRSQSGLTPK